MVIEIFLTLFGVTVGWLVAGHQFRVYENSNIINDHISDITRFANAVLEHWTTSYSNVSNEIQQCEIAKVKALYAPIPAFYGEAEFRLGTHKFREYQVLQLKLFKCATGGNFETIGRSFDGNAAIETQTVASELIQNLREARREQYGVHAIVASSCQRVFGKTKQYADR